MLKLQKFPTVLSLLFANGLTLYLAISQSWGAHEVLFILCIQTLIIGIFALIRAVIQPVKRLSDYGWMCVFGFVLFWSTLLCFSLIKFQQNVAYAQVTLPIAVFFINHLFSFVYFQKFAPNQPFKTQEFFTQVVYRRILPMNIVLFPVLLLPNDSMIITIFLVIKTGFDVYYHVTLHKQALVSHTK